MGNFSAGALAKFHRDRNKGPRGNPRSFDHPNAIEAQQRKRFRGVANLFNRVLPPTEFESKRRQSPPPTALTTLPIEAKLADIKRALEKSDFTIVRAATGSGKSTQIPRLAARMLEGTPGRVTCIVPRRLLAAGLGHHTATLEGEARPGGRVGYRHGLKTESSPRAKMEYITDAYRLVGELVKPSGQEHVVLIDEFHARSIASELLLALFLKRRDQGEAIPRIGILSATIDAEALSKHVGGAPIIDCEGRCFPITQREPGISVAADAVMLAREGKNVLVFLYGWPAIDKVTAEIQNILSQSPEQGFDSPSGRDTPIEIIPLHSQLSHEEQQRAFRSYDHPKIILATNCAEVGITIPDIHAVVCSGLVRRAELDDEGVPTLAIRPETQRSLWQQIGRAGRTSPGVAIIHGRNIGSLRMDPPPDIQNVPLEDWILRLLVHGEDIRGLVPYLPAPPSEQQIELGYASLFTLGLAGRFGHKTKLGERVAQLPVSVRQGLLLIRALDQAKLGKPILAPAIDLAAICDAQGILSGEGSDWRHLCQAGHASDHLAQLEVFYNAPKKIWADVCEQAELYYTEPLTQEVQRALKALANSGSVELLLERPEISRHCERVLYEEASARLSGPGKDTLFRLWGQIVSRYQEVRDCRLSQMGLNVTNIRRALDIRTTLRRRMHCSEFGNQTSLSTFERNELQLCIWSSMTDQLFRRVGRDPKGHPLYQPVEGGQNRRLDRDSVIVESPFVVGSPLNLGILEESGNQKFLPLISMASAVERSWLERHTPEPLSRAVKTALAKTPDHLPEKQNLPRDQQFVRPVRGRGRRGKGGF